MNEEMTNNPSREAAARQLNEWALAGGLRLLSAETGFLHYSPRTVSGECHQAISIAENFLLALTLMKSRTVEHILQAKTLLERILCFQSPTTKSWPVYLHDFPVCSDRWMPLRLLPILAEIQNEFSAVLGPILNKAVGQAIQDLLEISLEIVQDVSLPCSLLLGWAWAAEIASPEQLSSAIQACRDKAQQRLLLRQLLSPQEMALCFFFLLRSPDLFSKPAWQELWCWLSHSLYQPTQSYAGPAFWESQEKGLPEVSLYDILLGYLNANLSSRLKNAEIPLLQAALLPQTTEHLRPLMLPFLQKGIYKDHPWQFQQRGQIAWSAIDIQDRQDPSLARFVAPFRLNYSVSDCPQALICQGGLFTKVSTVSLEDGVDLHFSLADIPEGDDREKPADISFFWNIEGFSSWTVEESRSNTFLIGEKIQLHSKEWVLNLSFHLPDGDHSSFCGHVMRGNRPSEISLKGANRFQSYDWHLFLRSIERSTPCYIIAKIRWQS